MQHALQLLSAALLVGFAVSLLWSESQLVELNSQIQNAKADLVSVQSQYTYYNSALNNRTNITSVEETATRLGLMKIDQSQITYIRLDGGSVLVRKGVRCAAVDRPAARRRDDDHGQREPRKLK